MAKRLTVFEVKGDPDQLLEAKRAEMDPVMERKAPEYGALLHIAAKGADGLMIVNLWESEEGSDRAFQDAEIQEARTRLAERIGADAPTGAHYEVVDFREAS